MCFEKGENWKERQPAALDAAAVTADVARGVPGSEDVGHDAVAAMGEDAGSAVSRDAAAESVADHEIVAGLASAAPRDPVPAFVVSQGVLPAVFVVLAVLMPNSAVAWEGCEAAFDSPCLH